MNTYATMKDSRAGWLGCIPSTWGTRLLKYAFSIRKDIAGETGHTVLSVTQHGIVPKNMSDKGQFAKDYSNYQFVHTGDFVMNHMDLLTGWVDISAYEGVTSPDYRVFINNSPDIFDSNYYKYIFQYCYMNRVFYGLGQGVAGFGRWRLPADMFLNFVLPVPPINEQQIISRFLDEKCAQINAVIQEARASIEEYKHWKDSIIYETLTKGLDSGVQQKESGIDWIGKIPAGSTVMRMRYLVNGYKAGPFGSSLITGKLNSIGNILVYTPEHIAKQSVINEKNLFLPENRREQMTQFFVHPGDIIFPIVGSLGRAMLITDEMPEGIINQRLAKFRINEDIIDVNFFLWFFAKSSFYNQFIEVNCRGSFILNLTKTIIYDMPVILPSTIEEQKRIADYLHEKCTTIDSLIQEKESLLNDLESYKRALIFEIVTGKRKVV